MFVPLNILNICQKTICQNYHKTNITNRRGYKLQIYKNVSILSAIRTPWSSSYNHLSNDSEESLHLQVAQSVIKRAACLDFDFNSIKKQIEKGPWKKFYIIEKPQKNYLSKNQAEVLKDIRKDDDYLFELFENLQKVESGNTNTFLLSEYNTIEKSLLKDNLQLKKEENVKRFLEARGNQQFDEEIITVQCRKMADNNRNRYIMHYINQDMLPFCKEESKVEKIMAASALLFENDNYGEKSSVNTNSNLYKTLPLANLCGLMFLNHLDKTNLISSIQESLNKILSSKNLNLNDIEIWLTNEDETIDNNNNLSLILSEKLNISKNRINSFGITNIYKTFQNYNIAWLLTHAVYHIKPDRYCCLLKLDHDWNLSIFLLHGRAEERQTLPVLTLFTKVDCSLCDDLVEQLETQFSNQFHLEKIYIDDVSNNNYLKLYQFDIPILFLNRKFLCMHRLNIDLLEKKLKIIRENRGKQQI